LNVPDYPLNTKESKESFLELSKYVFLVLTLPLIFSVTYFLLNICLNLLNYINLNILGNIYKFINDKSFYFYTWPITFMIICLVFASFEALIFRINLIKNDESILDTEFIEENI
tara:strand:- start:2758 stop:3099 length:342 start_codon:yes stop_codon:yes gene_type:complete